MNSNLLSSLDDEILGCISAIEYAEEHMESIIASAYGKCVRKVYTTAADGLGITCPSLVDHRVIAGCRRGRILKQIPHGESYCEIGYDKYEKPLYFKSVGSSGMEFTSFFFDYDNFTWVMDMEMRFETQCVRKVSYCKVKKYRYDEHKRISYYAELSSPQKSTTNKDTMIFHNNIYEYPIDPVKPIVCHFYYYLASFEETGSAWHRTDVVRFIDTLYEISPDHAVIREFERNADGEYMFSREIKSRGKKSANAKSATNTYKDFSQWLNCELERKLPKGDGVYFDILEPTEDGFGIHFCIADTFNVCADEWACNVSYTSAQFMVITNDFLTCDEALRMMVNFAKAYLKSGKHRNILFNFRGIGAGFPDGNIEYIYIKKV